MTIHRSAALAVAFALAACGQAAVDPAGGVGPALFVDARSGGAAGFWFLPPIAPEPGDTTPNHRGLAPGVQVEALAADGAVVIATLTGEVKDAGAHYQADWAASDAPLAPGATYRIEVLLSGARLGYADAQVSEDGSELRFLYSDETFPLTGARTLPIKFRIAEPAPDADGDLVPDSGDACPTVADPVQLDTDADGVGDACECLDVTCVPLDACHVAGTCDPATGSCTTPAAEDGTACELADAAGTCEAGVCVEPAAASGGCEGCDGTCEAGPATLRAVGETCPACGHLASECTCPHGGTAGTGDTCPACGHLTAECSCVQQCTAGMVCGGMTGATGMEPGAGMGMR